MKERVEDFGMCTATCTVCGKVFEGALVLHIWDYEVAIDLVVEGDLASDLVDHKQCGTFFLVRQNEKTVGGISCERELTFTPSERKIMKRIRP